MGGGGADGVEREGGVVGEGMGGKGGRAPLTTGISFVLLCNGPNWGEREEGLGWKPIS